MVNFIKYNIIKIAIASLIIISMAFSVNAGNIKIFDFKQTQTDIRAYPSYSMSCDICNVEFNLNSYGYRVVIKNTTDAILEIVWDQCAIINTKGASDRVFLSTTKYVDKGNSIPSMVLPPGASTEQFLFPTGLTWYSGGWSMDKYVDLPYWEPFYIKPTKPERTGSDRYKKFLKDYDKKTVGVMLTVKCGDNAYSMLGRINFDFSGANGE